MKEVGDPQAPPDGKWIAYTVTSLDREADKLRTVIWTVDLEGNGRPWRSPTGPTRTHRRAGARTGRSWRSSPRALPRGSRRSGCLTGAAAKRARADERQGRYRRLRMVAGRQAPRSDHAGKRGGRGRRGRPQSQGAEADRHRSISLQAGHRGLRYRLVPRSPLSLRGREQELEALTGEKEFDESDRAGLPTDRRSRFPAITRRKPIRPGRPISLSSRRAPGPRRASCLPSGSRRTAAGLEPDGRTIAFLQGLEGKLNFYNLDRLAVVPAAGGEPRVLVPELDRAVSQAEFTPDGSALLSWSKTTGARTWKPPSAAALERLSDGSAAQHARDGRRAYGRRGATDTSATETTRSRAPSFAS